MDVNNQVFFSYAWRDDNEAGASRELIVDELYDSLTREHIRVVRDKKNLPYKGSIADFMKEIGSGNRIIVVISNKYLKSPNCMFELLEIYRKSNSDIEEMRAKIFPIILEDAKIYDPLSRLDYTAYWKEKKKPSTGRLLKLGWNMLPT